MTTTTILGLIYAALLGFIFSILFRMALSVMDEDEDKDDK